MIDEKLSLKLNLVRHKRECSHKVAELIASIINESDVFEWSMLSDMPEWIYWPELERDRLLMVAGALFCAPAIKLWIDASKVRDVRSLIGAKTFSLVMNNDVVPRIPPQLPTFDDVSILLKSTGSAVLINSANTDLHGYLSRLLPNSAGILPFDIAQLVLTQSTAILHEVNQELSNNNVQKNAKQGHEESVS